MVQGDKGSYTCFRHKRHSVRADAKKHHEPASPSSVLQPLDMNSPVTSRGGCANGSDTGKFQNFLLHSTGSMLFFITGGSVRAATPLHDAEGQASEPSVTNGGCITNSDSGKHCFVFYLTKLLVAQVRKYIGATVRVLCTGVWMLFHVVTKERIANAHARPRCSHD